MGNEINEPIGAVQAVRWLSVGAVIRGEGHVWVGDEPRSIGGDGTGPSPFAQVAGALAACTISTLASQAKIEGIELDDCRVSVNAIAGMATGRERPGGDLPALADDDNIDVRIKKLSREIEVRGTLSAEDVARLGDIAERCPVSMSIEGGIPIRTRISLVERLSDD